MPLHVASRRRTTLRRDFPDARILDVTSRAPQPWVRLSPFYLGAEHAAVLLDYTANGDVADLSSPLSHAALVAQRVQAP